MTKFTTLSSAATVSSLSTLTPAAPKAAAQRAAVRELPLRLATEEALGTYFPASTATTPAVCTSWCYARSKNRCSRQ